VFRLLADLRAHAAPPEVGNIPVRQQLILGNNIDESTHTHAKRTQVQIAPGGEIAALARPEADSETSLARRGSGRVQLPDLRG
jgi:hypothetical protein